MQNTLTVAVLQSHLYWENPMQNRKHFEAQINAITKPVDVLILPEMFTTGFTMQPELVAETMSGETVRWMQSMAANANAALVGSICSKENNTYYNRLLFVEPSGQIHTYDKRHTFTLAGEDKVYTAGKKRLIVNYKGWKICPLICYDLRFPVWSRNTNDYDLLIYVANWPKVRVDAWSALLKARAIENMSYCIGVNRVGLDANNYEYNGASAILDCLGKTIEDLKGQSIAVATLNKAHQDKIRKKLQFLNDKDGFSLTM